MYTSTNSLFFFLLATSLLNSALSTPLIHSVVRRTIPTATGVNLLLPTNAFGAAIEGVSVNKQGDVFAADFRGNGQNASVAYAFFNRVADGIDSVLSDLNPVFTAPEGVTPNRPLLAGGRILRDGRVLLTDAANKRVLSVNNVENDFNTFCNDERMLQPNDLALSTQRDILIFLSGQNFTADTSPGVSGDLWTCDSGLTIQFPPSILASAGIHRTNGIEADPTGKYLYVSSAKNVNGSVIENAIFRFELDPNTRYLIEQAPSLFFNFLDTPETDIDGMRTDTEGNLFVTRNGVGEVIKLSSEGEQLEVIEFLGMGGPSNLEFGGPNGSTLFVIGKCSDDATIGCAGSFETDSVGRAFQTLQKDW